MDVHFPGFHMSSRVLVIWSCNHFLLLCGMGDGRADTLKFAIKLITPNNSLLVIKPVTVELI